MDALQPILEKDPAVNPPCIVTAGSSLSVENEVGNAEGDSAPQLSNSSSASVSGSSLTKRKKGEQWADQFFRESKNIIRK